MTEKTQIIRDDILQALLPDIPFDGWTWPAVCRAAGKAGYEAEMAGAVFPGRLDDVLVHFVDWADRAMLERLKSVNIVDLRVRDRIHSAVMARFEALQPYKEAERLALTYWTRPFRGVRGSRLLWRTADRIWNWAGDTATDYNRYTKRGLLSGVISTTAMAWLNDESDELAATERFLARRIENVMQFGRILGKLKKAS